MFSTYPLYIYFPSYEVGHHNAPSICSCSALLPVKKCAQPMSQTLKHFPTSSVLLSQLSPALIAADVWRNGAAALNEASWAEWGHLFVLLLSPRKHELPPPHLAEHMTCSGSTFSPRLVAVRHSFTKPHDERDGQCKWMRRDLPSAESPSLYRPHRAEWVMHISSLA